MEVVRKVELPPLPLPYWQSLTFLLSAETRNLHISFFDPTFPRVERGDVTGSRCRIKNFKWKRYVSAACARAHVSSRYATACRLGRFASVAITREHVSTYAAPCEEARRDAKVRGDVSPKKKVTTDSMDSGVVALCNLTTEWLKRLRTNRHSDVVTRASVGWPGHRCVSSFRLLFRDRPSALFAPQGSVTDICVAWCTII